jgi:hypothetical protein
VIFDGGIQAPTSAGPGKNGIRTSSRRTIEPRPHRAGDESRLHLKHGVIDRRSEAFVQDLHSEQFRRSGGAVFVGRGHGDVKGQSLVGIPGQSGFLEALDLGERDVVELIDGGVDRHGDITGEGGVEDSRGIGGEVEILLELGTAVVFVA